MQTITFITPLAVDEVNSSIFRSKCVYQLGIPTYGASFLAIQVGEEMQYEVMVNVKDGYDTPENVASIQALVASATVNDLPDGTIMTLSQSIPESLDTFEDATGYRPLPILREGSIDYVFPGHLSSTKITTLKSKLNKLFAITV